jgi:hypothetical protein
MAESANLVRSLSGRWPACLPACLPATHTDRCLTQHCLLLSGFILSTQAATVPSSVSRHHKFQMSLLTIPNRPSVRPPFSLSSSLMVRFLGAVHTQDQTAARAADTQSVVCSVTVAAEAGSSTRDKSPHETKNRRGDGRNEGRNEGTKEGRKEGRSLAVTQILYLYVLFYRTRIYGRCLRQGQTLGDVIHAETIL